MTKDGLLITQAIGGIEQENNVFCRMKKALHLRMSHGGERYIYFRRNLGKQNGLLGLAMTSV